MEFLHEADLVEACLRGSPVIFGGKGIGSVERWDREDREVSGDAVMLHGPDAKLRMFVRKWEEDVAALPSGSADRRDMLLRLESGRWVRFGRCLLPSYPGVSTLKAVSYRVDFYTVTVRNQLSEVLGA